MALAARAAARFSAPTGIRPGSSPFSRAHRSRTSPEGPGFSPCKRATLRPGRARTSISAHQVPQPGLAPSWPGITGPDRAVPVWQSTPPGLADPVPGCRGSVHRNTGVASGRAHRLGHSVVSAGTPSRESSRGISIIRPSWCSSTRARSETRSLRSAESSV